MNKIDNKNYPVDKCLHHFIEDKVLETPNKTALIFEGKSLSYKDLNNRANKLANDLIAKGVKPDTIIGVCSERSFEMVIALVGIIKAGGAYMPIDPHLPDDRIRYMVEESNTLVVTGQERFHGKLDSSVDFIDLSAYLNVSEEVPNPNVNMTSENLAYLIYTSGSTGNPKGVMNQHNGIVNRLMWMQDEFQMTPEDNVIQKTPYSFDVSVWEFFWTLMMGATMIIARAEGHKDPEYLLNLIEQEYVTIIHFVPSMLRIFLQAQRIERSDSLRYVICSGEALDVPIHNRFFELCKGELYNLYGPTEAAVDVTTWQCKPSKDLASIPIGFPITNIGISIHDEEGREVPNGEEGELYISGIGVARGYINRPELTAEKFISRTDEDGNVTRFYKTGDLAKYREDGAVDYLGRIDSQVKIRGFRVELGEIEACLEELDEVDQAVVLLREDTPGNQRLVGYVKLNEGSAFSLTENKEHLKRKLPEYMVPAYYVMMEDFPLSPNGKLARKLFPKPVQTRPDIATPYIKARSSVEEKLVNLWQEQLDLDKIGIDDSFFEIGGTSLLAIELITKINNEFKTDYQVLKIFQYPTIAQFSELVEGNIKRSRKKSFLRAKGSEEMEGIAVIGMGGRFPGADTVDKLWENLINEVESITRFTKDELDPGIDEALLDNPDYILARGIVENPDLFDAPFFGVSPLEAKVMDPQQRVFLEEAWKALESSGYDSESYEGVIGAFAGIGDNHYLTKNLIGHRDLLDTVGNLTVEYGNQKDYIATRTCYALNLDGPGISVNTGCSTSLLAIDLAFRSLRDYECDIALAGGSDICIPQKKGFLYQLGGTFAKDGHCRPFDADATGTMFNDAVGVVVLKRLQDAIADNDTIYATIMGSAKNNDGSQKVSFLAPSVSGQSDVIERAHAIAGIEAEEVGYIEAHGTATPIGDPIEIEALTKTFRQTTDKKQFCRIGSVKGNIGHPTIASGVTGLIKASLCLHNETIPATLHYKAPNPQIDFPNSPFMVVDKKTEWKRNDKKRIAGVSSFGFGGTNVHVILKEAPLPHVSSTTRPVQLLLMSAKTKSSLDKINVKMGDFLERKPWNTVGDTAYTLQTGRRSFSERRFVVLDSNENPKEVLSKLTPLNSSTRTCLEKEPKIVFMFPGQGSQYVHMGKQLYASEPIFKQAVDQCCAILNPIIGRDLKSVIHPEVENEKAAYEALKDTYYTQPAIFVIEYSLAMLVMSWGIQPSLLIGHSVGEFVCACLSGVFTLKDALTLIAERGRLVKEMPKGSMLSARESEENLQKYLSDDVQMAAVNSPRLCVLAGPDDAVEKVAKTLEADGISSRLLHTSHGFHSNMMLPVVPQFTDVVKKVTLNPPQIPIVSSVLGKEVTTEMSDPEYWGQHVRNPVLFSHAIQYVIEKKDAVYIELGPRNTLATLTRQHNFEGKAPGIIQTMADNADGNTEYTALLKAMGQLWAYGYSIDWKSFYQNESRNKIPAPTYEFDHKSYWVDPVGMKIAQSEILKENYTDDFIDASPDKEGSHTFDHLTDKVKSILEETSGLSLSAYSENSTFIEMGMDSLLLTQIAFRISKEFKTKLTFGQLMQEYPNIDLLVTFLSSSSDQSDTKKSESSQIDLLVKKTGEYDLLPDHLALLNYSSPNSQESNGLYESVVLHLKGKIKKEVIDNTIHTLVENHEALRASFDSISQKIVIGSASNPEITRFKKSESLSDFLNDSVFDSMSLDLKPLSHFSVAEVEDNTYITITCHSLICDGWGLDVLITDFTSIYNNLSQGNTPNQKNDYDLSDYLISNLAAVRKNSFLSTFKRDKIFDHITEIDYQSIYKATNKYFELSDSETEKLRGLYLENGNGLFNFLITSILSAAFKLSNEKDISLAYFSADQSRLNQYNLVGNCTRLLPLNVNIDNDQTFKELSQKVQAQFIHNSNNIEQYPASNSYKLPIHVNYVKIYNDDEIENDYYDFSYHISPKNLIYTFLRIDIHEYPNTFRFSYSFNEDIIKEDQVNALMTHILQLLINDNVDLKKRVVDWGQKQFISTITSNKEFTYLAKKTSTNKLSNLSSAQKRLWFFNQLDPSNPAYNLALSFKFEVLIANELLQKTLSLIVNKHKSFLTSFHSHDGVPEVHHNEMDSVNFKVIDVTGNSTEEKKKNLKKQIISLARTPFDFKEPPLYNFTLFSLSPKDNLLVLFIPHILIDGWSYNVIYNDIKLVYTSLMNGNDEPKLPQLNYEYSDFTNYTEKKRREERNAEGLAYWKEYLGENTSTLEFPYDYLRPQNLTANGSTSYFTINKEQYVRIKEICLELTITPFVFLLSSLHLLFHIFSRQNEVIIGIPYANREEKMFEGIVGLFLNMLSIKADFNESPDFLSLLNQVNKGFLDSFQYRDIEFEEIIKHLKQERQLNTHPIFQIMFAFQSYLKDDDETVNIRQEFVDRGLSEYDFSFYIWEAENQFKGALEYSTDLLNQNTIENLLETYLHLIDEITLKKDKQFSELKMLSTETEEKVLYKWNDTICDNSKYNTLLDVFRENANKNGTLNAIEFAESKLSYKELNAYSNQIANYLCNIGVKKGDKVGISLERNIDLIAIVLGILKCGASYIPLDPSFPKDRISYMIDNSGLGFLVSEKHLLEGLTYQNNVQLSILSKVQSQIKKQSNVFNFSQISGDDLAYIIYTSGSTGKPKGVIIHHKAILNFLLSMKAAPGARKGEKILALTTLSFDISCLEIFLPLISGATISLYESSKSMDVLELVNHIDKNEITIMQATPATYNMLFEVNWKPKNMIKLLCGGEAMSKSLAVKLMSVSDDVWNMFGPTETTVWSSIKKLTPNNADPTIGRPIANTQMYILDENLNPLPIGTYGELYIGGDGVSHGYLNREDLTKERFVLNPFIEGNKNYIYRTGDLCRFLLNGEIEYFGRVDFQVKLRGFRIELGEIEQVIDQFDGIKESVCVVLSNDETDKRLVSYYKTSKDIDKAQLKDHLLQKLPDYMVPNLFIELDSFPLTESGKVDRKGLPKPTFTRDDGKQFIAPSTDNESKMLSIWRNILKIDKISMDDSFFDLGGHSLLASELIFTINKSFNANWKLFDLFQNPTIQGLLSKSTDHSVNAESENGQIIELNNSKSENLVYFVVGVQLYSELAEELSDVAKCYGTFLPIEEALLLGEQNKENWDVSDLASGYKKTISEHSKGKPVTIIGISFGGFIAYELSRQLQESGQEVKLMVMLDSWLNSGMKKQRIKWLSIKLRESFRCGLRGTFRAAKERLNKQPLEINNKDEIVQQRIVLYRRAVRLFEEKKSINYNGNALLIKAVEEQNRPGYKIDPSYGWNEYLNGEFNIEEAPGGHLDILKKPNVAITAKKIKENLKY